MFLLISLTCANFFSYFSLVVHAKHKLNANQRMNKQTNNVNQPFLCMCGSWNVVKLFFLYFMYLNAEQLKFSIHEMSSQNGSFLFPSKRFGETSNFIPFDTILIRYSNHSFDFHEHSCIIIEKNELRELLNLEWITIKNTECRLFFFSQMHASRNVDQSKNSLGRIFFGQQLKFHWMNEW